LAGQHGSGICRRSESALRDIPDAKTRLAAGRRKLSAERDGRKRSYKRFVENTTIAQSAYLRGTALIRWERIDFSRDRSTGSRIAYLRKTIGWS
jgi:hypothetical protein